MRYPGSRKRGKQKDSERGEYKVAAGKGRGMEKQGRRASSLTHYLKRHYAF